ncbi:pyrimidine reductase family protein [Amycolatopsis sp. H20-H5]|uniref:pyrimidine reductase family protein n=1 Tax=Amycolatopsis sp. H20-H5 TaxID=3046309 RepID=UPI002DBE175C|nr:pyrimidine reductase family protein [Amycolatopsis sp. H20-H5]MEC3981098.1 pyrimidine reductase family protein [Amycolatopsis sp. H20-H5]
MQSLWPTPPSSAGPVSDGDLERIYAYPGDLDRAWVQVNFVASADGAMSLDDLSEGLSHPADKRIFLLGRDLADVILVGAGTARAEGYGGVRTSGARAERRARLGLSATPPIAVVTRSAQLDPAGPLFTDTKAPALIITTEDAPAERKAALAEAGAELVIAGRDQVDLPGALAQLAARGLRRVDCEGGPSLFADLIAADLVDQLCLTVGPLLAGAGAGRIAHGTASAAPRRLDLASILLEDSFTMLRYRRSSG